MKKEVKPIDVAKVRKGVYELLAALFQVLANASRIQILDLLRNNPPSKTFSDIMFSLRMNPNVMNQHLQRLIEFGLVKRTAEGHYKITDIGNLALSATSENILQIVENALALAKKSKDIEVA